MAEVPKVTELDKQMAAGLSLFASDVKLELDTAGAEAYKAEVEAKLESLKEEEKALTGKDNKKAKTEKAKEASALKCEKKYIDATKVVKGVDPPNGHFILQKTGGEVAAPAAAAAAPAAEEPKKEDKEKKEKPRKKGLTGDEEKELDKLKNDLIARKTELKAEGKSGGEQNKDEQIMGWVKRMNELKEIQEPGSTGKKPAEEGKKKKGGKLSVDDQAEFDVLKDKIEAYKENCVKEFGMTKKDLKVDPDLLDMEKQLADFEKRAK